MTDEDSHGRRIFQLVAAHLEGMATAKQTRHSELGLTPERLLQMYRQMLLARAVDRKMWVLNRQGKAPFVISGQGHEAAQVGAAAASSRTGTDRPPISRCCGT